MKFALISIGNEESYGLLFVGGELLIYNQEIKFFDAEESDIHKKIITWNPDYIAFSPMSLFFNQTLKILKPVKKALPSCKSIYGGHHAIADPDIINNDLIDFVVVGPVRGSIQKILNNEYGVIKICPTQPADLPMPSRKEYYCDIPRIAKRYRKVMISLFGCPWNCSYCSSSSKKIQKTFGIKAHKNYFMTRRPIKDIIKEAKEIMALSETHEIEWVDDDIFSGGNYEEWLLEFIDIWKKEINIPMYISTTSKGLLKASDKLLIALRTIVNCIGMGVQAKRASSLKLFNRSWDNEDQLTSAYKRGLSLGYRINLQAIVGLPINDPVEDAIETVMAMQRIGSGSIVSIYPLQIYPGTEMIKYCKLNNIELNESADGDTNSGSTGVKFNTNTLKQLKNICKLGTLFVKYSIDEAWIRILINCNFDNETSKNLSMQRYYECVVDRLDEKGKILFNDIQKSMKIKY